MGIHQQVMYDASVNVRGREGVHQQVMYDGGDGETHEVQMYAGERVGVHQQVMYDASVNIRGRGGISSASGV